MNRQFKVAVLASDFPDDDRELLESYYEEHMEFSYFSEVIDFDAYVAKAKPEIILLGSEVDQSVEGRLKASFRDAHIWTGCLEVFEGSLDIDSLMSKIGEATEEILNREGSGKSH